MTTTLHTDTQTHITGTTTDRPRTAPARRRVGWRHLLFVGVPAAWAAVALLHPAGGESVFTELEDQVPLWIGLHLTQLVCSVGLAAALWQIVGHRDDPAARIAKPAIAIYLAFFGAFDAVAGFSTGIAVHHASSLTGVEQAGAASTADYLMNNQIASNSSPVAAVATAGLVMALAGTAMCLRRAGAPRSAWAMVLGGILLATHAGAAAAIGLVVLAFGLCAADRRGYTRSATDAPTDARPER